MLLRITDVGLCGKWFDGVKPTLMANRWAVDFVAHKFALVGTPGTSSARLFMHSCTRILNADTFMDKFSMLHLHWLN